MQIRRSRLTRERNPLRFAYTYTFQYYSHIYISRVSFTYFISLSHTSQTSTFVPFSVINCRCCITHQQSMSHDISKRDGRYMWKSLLLEKFISPRAYSMLLSCAMHIRRFRQVSKKSLLRSDQQAMNYRFPPFPSAPLAFNLSHFSPYSVNSTDSAFFPNFTLHSVESFSFTVYSNVSERSFWTWQEQKIKHIRIKCTLRIQ